MFDFKTNKTDIHFVDFEMFESFTYQSSTYGTTIEITVRQCFFLKNISMF